MREGKVLQANNKYGSMLVCRVAGAVAQSKKEIDRLAFEPAVTKIIEKGDYDYFLDVGAGFGYYSRIASHYAKKVIAFEAHPIRYGFTKWNTMDLDNVEVHERFVGNNPVHIRKDNPYGLVRKEWKGFTIPYGGVDNIRLTDVLHNGWIPYGGNTLIKIDVEGNEEDVIRSAFPLEDFESCKFIVEIHVKSREIKPKDIFNLFDGWQYKEIKVREKDKHVLFWKE